MSTVLFIVTYCWTLPHLFKGLNVAIEDVNNNNATIFESFLPDNETNATYIEDAALTATAPSDFVDTTFVVFLDTESRPNSTDLQFTTEYYQQTFRDDNDVTAEEVSTSVATPGERKTITDAVDTTATTDGATEVTTDFTTQTMLQENPKVTMVAVTESIDYAELYGEECGLEGGVQCDGTVKCRGRGKIDCNIKEDLLEGGRQNVSLFRGRRNARWRRRSAVKISPTECRISGKAICFPTPTVANCKGQGSCVPVSEQNFGPRDLQDWEIAVITVLCVVGLLLIFLMVYILYSSFRKLKVRPDVRRLPSAQTP